MAPEIRAGRFRWRLTVAFVVVSGLSAATVAVGAYYMVLDSRSDAFLDRSLRDAEADYLIAERRGEALSRDDLESLLRLFERRSGARTLALTPQGTLTSPGIDEGDIPEALRSSGNGATADEMSHADSTEGDHLVVAAPQTTSGVTMYFFYAREGLTSGLRDLAGILTRLWIVVVAGSALIGNILARRTLRPVARASEAAHSLAEGLLDTRLQVESEDEFGAWAYSFNTMADALQKKITQLTDARERERRFTSDVAHELRTPLTALVSSASMMAERLDQMDPETRWAAERTIDQSRRLRVLVDELLEISRLHAGRESIEIDRVALDRLVENVIATRGWKDRIRWTSSPVVVETDKRRVERIVSNLLSNAINHGERNPRVSTLSVDGTALIEVSDDGPGMTPDRVKHVFERFYKVDESRRGGSGLGLSIAAEHARLLGGTIEVASEPGKGATFTLRLPPRAPEVVGRGSSNGDVGEGAP